MALVTCYDPEGQAHQKEPIDAREACLHNGFTMALPGTEVAVEATPTLAELLGMRDALVRREGELDDHAERLREMERANEAEAQRLAQVAAGQADEAARLTAAAAQLATDRAAFDAAKTTAPAPATGKNKPAAA